MLMKLVPRGLALPLALVLLSATVPGSARTLNNDFVYPSSTEKLYEGDECEFPGTPRRTGICRRAAECPSGIGRYAVHCEFSEHDTVVCCPSLAGKSQAKGVGTTRFMAGITKQECAGSHSKSSPLADYIVGIRNLVGIGEFPFMARVNFDDDDKIICAAALISKLFLLTSKSCIKYSPVSVTLGAVKRHDTDAAQYPIYKTHEYDRKKWRLNNIALIELLQEVSFDSLKRPICLYRDLHDIVPAVTLIAMGWDKLPYYSLDLSKVSVNRFNLDQCHAIYKRNGLPFNTTDKNMCVIGKLSNVTDVYDCAMYAGGQLILSIREKFYLVGVFSYGAVCGGPLPSVYTRVSHYIDWIEQKVWNEQ